MKDKVISFIQPSRNNLKYLKWSYNSIRKNLGYRHEICWADDFSNDGTWEWINEIVKKDPNVRIHRNEGPTRLGHTILYDTLVDMATSDIVMIYHADMYACPSLDKEIDKVYNNGGRNFLVENALSGSIAYVIAQKYPDANIFCAEYYSYFKEHLSNLAPNIVVDDISHDDLTYSLYEDMNFDVALIWQEWTVDSRSVRNQSRQNF